MKVSDFCNKWGLPIPNLSLWEIVRFDDSGYQVMKGHYSLIMSVLKYKDNKHWAHLSISHMNFLPGYKTLCEVKESFLGKDKRAIQVFAPVDQHVNIHPNCLHLWHCLDHDPLPDFRINGMI